MKSEKIRKIWRKSRLKREKIWKMRKKLRLNSEKIEKLWEKSKLNSEKIWKIQKKIVKRYGKYGRNPKLKSEKI